MADEQIKIDLDPKSLVDGLDDMSDEIKKLSEDVETYMGKKAVESMEKLVNASDKGTTRMTAMFRNLGTRVKEDLKTAFDATGVMAGMKFGKDLAEGVKQVFEMERAFDRLNTRLKLTTSQMEMFKSSMGRRVASTGQKIEDVLPGVETAAARGGVKSPEQLTAIGEMLGQVRATTGEGTADLSDTVVEILKNQGKAITAASFKSTLDALQATRVQGAFKTAGDAGSAIQQLSGILKPEQMKAMGLGSRELGGLAAMASRGGEHGQDILHKIMETAASPGGQQQLNAIFGGQIFKGGKFNASGFQSSSKNQFGQYTSQAQAAALGTNQADLSRFVDSMKAGLDDFKRVTTGANETAGQFETATDNLATKIDKFKESMKESGREIGESLSVLTKDVMSGNFGKAGGDLKKAGQALWENKGNVASGIGITAGVGLLAGGALNSLLSKVPGGGIAKGLAGGELAKQAGVTPVYVTNASDIGGGPAVGAMAGVGGKLAQGAAVVGAAAIGYEIGQAIMSIPIFKSMTGSATDYLHDKMYGGDQSTMDKASMLQMAKNAVDFNQRNGTSMTFEEYAKAVETGTLRAHAAANKKVQYTNPSSVTGRGGSM